MKSLSQLAVVAVMLVMAMAFTFGCANEPGNHGKSTVPAALKTNTYYLDKDGDSYGDASQNITAVNKPRGYSDVAGDCDDSNLVIHPHAEEKICSLVDSNCDNNLGPQSVKLYSLDQYDGNFDAYRGVFQSDFNHGISPWHNGFFTFDISEIDWNNVQAAEINAYILDGNQPCAAGDWFYSPSFQLNFLADDYYQDFYDCNCAYISADQALCGTIPNATECEYLYGTVFNQMLGDYSPVYYNSSVQTDNWWQMNLYTPATQSEWSSLDKKYISIFPTDGSCLKPSTNYPYFTNYFAFEDGGNHSGTSNLPYLKITCQP